MRLLAQAVFKLSQSGDLAALLETPAIASEEGWILVQAMSRRCGGAGMTVTCRSACRRICASRRCSSIGRRLVANWAG